MSSVFTSQLNIASGAVLTLSNYQTPTFSNLHLRGGILIMGAGQTPRGYIVVESNSVMTTGTSDNGGLTAVLSGSGNLILTNRQPSGRSMYVNADNSGYSGIWTLANATPASLIFGDNYGGTPAAGGPVGSGGLVFPPNATNIVIGCDTTCPWNLDLRGKSVTVCRSGGDNVHSGIMTLVSSCILKNQSNRKATFSGKITGNSKLLASFSGGTAVAAPSLKFISGELALMVTDGTCGANGTDTATVMVTRPAGCTNETLFVNYTTGGGAVAGTDYTISPVSGTLQLSPGQTNATVTIAPKFPPFNYGASKSIGVALAPGAYAIGNVSNATSSLATLLSGAYTWIGPANADWLVATNWSPAGFVNGTGDVCTADAGAQLRTTAASTFYGQLNLNAGSTFYVNGAPTFSNLHLRGSTITMADGQNMFGFATVESNSTIVSGVGYNNSISIVFGGTGNLSVTNLQAGVNNGTGLSGTSTNYGGVWQFYNLGVHALGMSGDPGYGGMYFNPLSDGVGISVNTHCPWWLDLQGNAVFVCGGGSANSYVHSGTFTLVSDSILDAKTDGYGKKGIITGPVTGPGVLLARLTTAGSASGTESLILTNSLNNYSGGTIVVSNWLEAATVNALGTGNVEVQPGGKLRVFVSGTVNPASKLYLDKAGGVSGLLDLGASTNVVTTVARAFVGGTGGWKASSGYTLLSPGTYSNGSTAVSGYVQGSGALKVLAPVGMAVFVR